MAFPEPLPPSAQPRATEPPGPETSRWRTEPGHTLALVEQWINTPALRQLVEADGGTWPTGSLAEVVETLAEFSTVWDTRGGDSRLVFKQGDESRTDERAQRTYAAARDLGLLDSEPPTTTEPDYLLILGGLATGVEPRVRYTAELVRSGAVTPGAVIALGSFREIDDRERTVANTYAPGARYEIDLLNAMIGSAFGTTDWDTTTIGDPADDPARAEQILRAGGNPPLATYAAPSSAPNQRPANTADTYHQFAADVSLHHGQELLIITSTIYRPYQHLDAVRTLSLEASVTIETIGVPSTTSATITHPPRSYLQELRSTLRSARLLIEANGSP